MYHSVPRRKPSRGSHSIFVCIMNPVYTIWVPAFANFRSRLSFQPGRGGWRSKAVQAWGRKIEDRDGNWNVEEPFHTTWQVTLGACCLSRYKEGLANADERSDQFVSLKRVNFELSRWCMVRSDAGPSLETTSFLYDDGTAVGHAHPLERVCIRR
ncbi:hypothetical protein EDD17DRAFT_228947 [Pisolithus thermaeus]|nr:hypothetical protein EV401DRAFT_1883190 [Pisolithus croceorrhizus]KAI6165426.1 hypothetical protein EDD17DRAFT_228947 [Pisolithus thermaeus]